MKNYLTFLLLFVIIELFSQNTYNEIFYKNKELKFIDDLQAADLDGDEDLDFVLTSYNGRKIYIALMENLKEPSIEIINDSLDIRNIVLYDFNGDGKIDIVGAAPFDDVAYWWENDGVGKFERHDFSLGEYKAINFGDIDGDDKDELILGHKDGIRIYSLNKGVATLKKIVVEDSWDGNPNSIFIYDNNNDNILDIVACYGFGAIKIYENEGSYKFKTIKVEPKVFNMEKIKSSDINGDSLMDLIAFSSYNGKTVLLINNGDGTYEKSILKEGGGRNTYSDFGDYDNDGDLDILYVESISSFESQVYILNNEKGVFKEEKITNKYDESVGGIGDIDNDGDADLYLFTNDFFNKGLLLFENVTPPSNSKEIHKSTEKINVFPNRCTTDITIDFPKRFSYNIIDIDGRKIKSGNGKNMDLIDCSDWKIGTYFIILNDGARTVSKKVIKVN